MEYDQAHGIFFGHILNLCGQSKAISNLLQAFDEFEVGIEDSRSKIEKLSPPEWRESRGARTDLPSELIQAQVDEGYLREARAIYAGALFVTLSSWIKSVGTRLELSPEDYLDCGKKVCGIHSARIIWAGANNFRHYDEWHPTANSGLALRSIAPLQSIGITAPWNRIVSSDALQILNIPRDFNDLLNKELAPIGHEIFAKSTGRNFWIKEFTYGWGS